MTALVEFRHVTAAYRQRAQPALVDATFHLDPGELLLVAGPSGSGKSTLLRLLNGLVPRSYRATVEGEIRLRGRDTAGLSLADIARTVGTLLQDPAKQIVGTTVLAELAFGLENRGVAPDEIRTRIDAVAARLGIAGLLDTPTAELSGGQLQIVAFAGILVLDPDVIVVDEPLANLDPGAARRLLGAVRDYVDAGGAAIVVEHRVADVLDVAPDRVLYLDEGRVAFSGDVGTFTRIASPVAVKLPFESLVERHRELPRDDTGPARPRPPADRTGGAARLVYRDVDLGYGDRTVVREVDTTFGTHERVAVLGANGAGKSTLLRAAVGLVEPSRGRVLVEGVPAGELGARELVAVFGYLFQDPGQALFSATVREELAFGPRNLGVPDGEIAAVAAAALRAVGLDAEPGILDRPPRTLSFGQQRRLAIALALTLRPRTLILDEPTAGQDERSTAHFLREVFALPDVESVYFITHDVDLALTRADRVLVVDHGAVVADATPAEIVQDRSLWQDGLLRETGLVRAARGLCPGPGTLPGAFTLARRAAALRVHDGPAPAAPSLHRSLQD